MAPTPIYGFSWGASNSGGTFGGGGAGAGKVTFTDVSFTKRADAISPES